MATTTRASGADEEAYQGGGERGGAAATDCALCQAPLPEGHKYLCAACAAESARRAAETVARLQTTHRPPEAASAEPTAPDSAEADDPLSCPTCGLRLDDSGRCANCVTTVRR